MIMWNSVQAVWSFDFSPMPCHVIRKWVCIFGYVFYLCEKCNNVETVRNRGYDGTIYIIQLPIHPNGMQTGNRSVR
jgi:hypothetical protein